MQPDVAGMQVAGNEKRDEKKNAERGENEKKKAATKWRKMEEGGE